MNKKKLFVGSLAWAIDDVKLADIFSQVGTVTSATVIKDRETGKSRGFGFVEMTTDEEAAKAIATLNETEVEGRKIIVSEAKERVQR